MDLCVKLCQCITKVDREGRFVRVFSPLLKMDFAGAVDSVNDDANDVRQQQFFFFFRKL